MTGFEFETSDLIFLAPGNTIDLHEPVIEGTGWGMFIDANLESTKYTGNASTLYTTYGSVEFVIYAIEEEDVARLAMTFTEVTELITQIVSSTSWRNKVVKLSELKFPKGVDWSQALTKRLSANKDGLARRNQIAIEVLNKSVAAAPQMTAGIKLVSLRQMIEYMAAKPAPGAVDFVGKSGIERIDAASRALYLNSRIVAERLVAGLPLDERWSDVQKLEYVGVLMQLVNVLTSTRFIQKCEWAKYLTCLLCRTNYGLLPRYVRCPRLKPDVLACCNYILTQNSKPAIQVTDRFLPDLPTSATVGAWLNGIISGLDPINWGQRSDASRWKPQLVGPRRQRGWGIVFEARGMPENVKLGDWHGLAKDCIAHISSINASVTTPEEVDAETYGTPYTPSSRLARRDSLDSFTVPVSQPPLLVRSHSLEEMAPRRKSLEGVTGLLPTSAVQAPQVPAIPPNTPVKGTAAELEQILGIVGFAATLSPTRLNGKFTAGGAQWQVLQSGGGMELTYTVVRIA